MALWDDEVDVFLKQLRQKRRDLADRLADGHVPSENQIGGYMHTVGHVSGLLEAEEAFRTIFQRWLPGARQPEDLVEKKKSLADRYL